MNWKRISQALSLIVVCIGMCGFAGWVFGLDALKRIHPAWVTMKANTALCLMLAGTAVAVLRDEDCGGLKRQFAQICAGVVGIVGLLSLCENLFGWDLKIDQALFTESLAEAGRSFPGRMGPASGLIFMLLGTAILILDVSPHRRAWPAQVCATAAAMVTFLIFLGYFYNVEIAPWMTFYVSIALHTVLAFLMLSAALLFARPERGFVGIFLAGNSGGIVARRMLPTALLAPALLGWLFVLGREAGYYGRGVGIALLAATVTFIFAALVWWTARALERIESARARLAAIVASSDDAIVSKDLEGIVQSWNTGAEKIFGYSADEMIGHSILRIVPPGREEEERDILRRVRAGDHIKHYETVRMTKAGRSINVSVTISPMHDATGAIIGASKIGRDITQRKQIEAELLAARDAAEAANRAKDDFLAALSHELRTPLTPVLMLAGDMEKSADTPAAVRHDFAMIRKNVELEARIIDDLLDLTRITRGKLILQFETVDVHALVEHALAILRSDSEAKKLAVTLHLDADAHHVTGDAVRLQQVFWNVVKNAIKFTPHGGRIVIRSWNENGLLRVAMTDTGIGIAPAEMPRIFTAFAQGREAADARFGGLGLGLSISALLIQEHRGHIWAESAGRDRGSTFQIELPLAATPAPGAPAPSIPSPSVRPLRILLVEDHEDTRGVLQRLMTRWGHSVTAAACVVEARQAIAGNTFDLLLSDVGLPDGSGYDVIAALREKSDARAVAMSGYGMEADLARTQAAGFTEHIVKPVSADKLRDLLTSFAGRAGP